MCPWLCGSEIANEIRLVLRINSDHVTLEGLRRALYNFLFSRFYNGKFILQLGLNKHGRQPRSKKIEAVLERFGLEPDEGPGAGGPFAPYSVSKRQKTYADAVERLINTGIAYRCFCYDDTWKDVDPMRRVPAQIFPCMKKCFDKSRFDSRNMASDGLAYVVRLRIPSGTYIYRDVVQGELPRRVAATDQLLLRPDFMPTSFFADVVDNHTLCASHYVASSSRDFLQLPICDALQWRVPTYINIGSLRLRIGSRLLTFSDARSYVRSYSSVHELSILNFLLAGRGVNRNLDNSVRLYSIDEMISKFNVNTITSRTLSIDTYKLMKPERQEILLQQHLDLDEEILSNTLINCCGIVKFSVISDSRTNNALIESLQLVDGELLVESNFYLVHLSIINEIVSSGDKNFWKNSLVRNFVNQLSANSSFDDCIVIMNVLFMLYCSLEEKEFFYDHKEEVVQKAIHLLYNKSNAVLTRTICNYLDKVFSREYNVRWVCSVIKLLKVAYTESLHASASELRKRLPQLLLRDPSVLSVEQMEGIFSWAKNVKDRSKPVIFTDREVVSTNFYFAKLLAKLLYLKQIDKKVLSDDWCSIHIRNEILLHLVALGRTELTDLLLSSSSLSLLDLIRLKHFVDKDCNARLACKFIESLDSPTLAMLNELYDVLEHHGVVIIYIGSNLIVDLMKNYLYTVEISRNTKISPSVMNSLLMKLEAWNNLMIPILATKAVKELNSSNWESRDDALHNLTLLVKYGYKCVDIIDHIVGMAKQDAEPYVRGEALVFLHQNGNLEDVMRVAVDVVLTDSDPVPRIEALHILENNLPYSEELCLNIIPKILYDEDIALHRKVIKLCVNLIVGGKNQELRNVLITFLEDEVDCYEELNEALYGNNQKLSGQNKENDELKYLFSVLEQQNAEQHDKDCYDL
ncbi:unnamed protein product [Thelazia callipaeda]|uniref:tRNA-synt_1c domain-containing protein n=1 Tax=Thelazia callipaeda TaxID=103827 RepID=A0A0N5CLZ9_THECL|nr:unnamed protein product [Thelazia callipaeda]